MANLIFYILCLVCSAIPLSQSMAQGALESPKRLSFVQWLQEIRQSEDTYKLDNAVITFDENDLYGATNDSVVVNADVELSNVTFQGKWISFSKIHFGGNLLFDKVKMQATDFHFQNCTFQNTFIIRESILDADVVFFQSHFQNEYKLILSSLRNISFEECKFRNSVVIHSTKYWGHIKFFTCEFRHITEEEEHSEKAHALLNMKNLEDNGNNSFVQLSNTKFLKGEGKESVIIAMSAIPKFIIENCLFEPLTLFSGTSVKYSLHVTDCDFKDKVDFSSFNFSLYDTDFDWNQIENRIVVAPHEEEVFGSKYQYYDPTISDKEFGNEKMYNKLIKTYAKFYNTYKHNLDNESGNACYKELKNLETKRLEYIYRQKPSFESYFDWQINLFLKTFSDYGTNPALSIIVSIQVILGFALLYFFYPGEYIQSSTEKFLRRMGMLNAYFAGTDSLVRLYERYKINPTSSNFKRFRHTNELHAPLLLRVSGDLIHFFSQFALGFEVILLKKGKLWQSKWTELQTNQRIRVKIYFIVWAIFWGVVSITGRSLNAFALSINTFTTLGFGDIPVKGVLKYIVILEGFIGWFLLSIFSVSLISQVLE